MSGPTRYDRKSDDIFALQDEIALSVVGEIEPSLRRAEFERVKRKRPDSLDAYDLVLQAQPDVFSGMPDRSEKALVLLDRAILLDPAYALAHGLAAVCFHNRFLRAGLHEEDRSGSIRHAQAAIAHGQDDALALTPAGFCIGMDGHDRAAAFAAFEAALAVSPSTALSYICGSVILGWTGEAKRAIEWGERGIRLSPFDPWAFAAFHSLTLGHFHPRPLRRSSQSRLQGRPIQSGPQYLLYAARGAVGEDRAARRSQGGCGPRFGATTGVPVQPPIFRRGLRARASRLAQRSSPRDGTARLALQSMLSADRAAYFAQRLWRRRRV